MPCNIEAGLQGGLGEVRTPQSQPTSVCSCTGTGLVNHFLHRRFPREVTGVPKAMVVCSSCSSSGVAIVGAHVVKLAFVLLYCDHSSADQHPCPWHCACACVLMCASSGMWSHNNKSMSLMRDVK